MRRLRLLRREEGITLILAVAVLTVLAITGATVVFFANANARSAAYSRSDSGAYALAEAGLDEAISVLAKPGNNAFDASLLPGPGSPKTSTYAEGTVTWHATYETVGSVWTVTSVGRVANPTGPGTNQIQRTVSAKVQALPVPLQPLQAPAWNFLYSARTGNPCDMSIEQTVEVAAPLFVAGNLCLYNTSRITSGPLNVGGQLVMNASANAVGTSSKPIDDAHLAGGCKYHTNPLHVPCQGAVDNVHAKVLDSTLQPIPAPTVDWDGWYKNANPGPFYPCKTQSGTPPMFDTAERLRNDSVPGAFNLTPSSSYSCTTNGGEISWNASTRVLKVSGTIFIDGSATVDSATSSSYDGQGTIYLSGTFYMKNSRLCAQVLGNGRCNFNGWDPNQKLLVIVANGNGGQVPTGDSIFLKGADFQGGFFGTNAIELDTTSQSQGPMIASHLILGQTVSSSFPEIKIAPAAVPGNPPQYSTVSAPYDYSG
jgi:hypothetical protein